MPKLIEVDIRRFPYGIYYTIENEVVVIWAVKHFTPRPGLLAGATKLSDFSSFSRQSSRAWVKRR